MGNSIATKHGDGGQTGLVGGVRVSKSSLRVETYGTVDELNSFLGLARSICEDEEIRGATKQIQKELFQIGSDLATPAEAKKKGEPPVTEQMVESLTEQVHKIEAVEGILSDWSIPGEHAAAAAYDVARTVCRRAERSVVRLVESGEEVGAQVVPYLNRLSDLLWLFGRLLELKSGIDAKLRDQKHKGPRWSRAWD
jgi:cob(I)alamin adenosyltransferase